MRRTILTFVALMLTASAMFAETTYNNVALASGAIGPFGRPDTTTYGETFLAPNTDTILNNFSLFLNGGTTGQVQGYIASWTGANAGNLLYSSSLETVTGAAQEFDFDTGALDLVAGDSYVAFLSIDGSEYYSYSGNTTMPGVWGNDTVPGGSFVYLNNSTSPSQFTTFPWNSAGGSFTAEFTANFDAGSNADPSTATPEPSSLILFGTGLAGFVSALRRKRV